jgi:hypothetical protein
MFSPAILILILATLDHLTPFGTGLVIITSQHRWEDTNVNPSSSDSLQQHPGHCLPNHY